MGKTATALAPSHMQVKCPIALCNKSVRQDRMKDHLRVIHGEKNYVPPTQPLLSGFFNVSIIISILSAFNIYTHIIVHK